MTALICTSGSLAGVALANFATSGSFDIYQQRSAVAWQPELQSRSDTFDATDPAFASYRRAGREAHATDETLASLNR